MSVNENKLLLVADPIEDGSEADFDLVLTKFLIEYCSMQDAHMYLMWKVHLFLIIEAVQLKKSNIFQKDFVKT